MAASGRNLVQAVEGCSASPGSQTPPECSGSVFAGNQWDKDELGKYKKTIYNIVYACIHKRVCIKNFEYQIGRSMSVN